MLGSVLASGTIYLLFAPKVEAYFGTLPVGSDIQSLVLEIIISFLLMFVISGVATDNRAVSTYLIFIFTKTMLSFYFKLRVLFSFLYLFFLKKKKTN